jgi:hypothetical protein
MRGSQYFFQEKRRAAVPANKKKPRHSIFNMIFKEEQGSRSIKSKKSSK